MASQKDQESNNAFLDSIYYLHERKIPIFASEVPCFINGFPYSDTALSMKDYIALTENDEEIDDYISGFISGILTEYPVSNDIKTIGVIVMNCNPFTFGHRHLIEYASGKVDRLYVFCVEEDRSFFRFEDRIEMIKKGISDLKNVVVVPSGRYIISTDTFPEYFVKESIEDDKIDVTWDLTIFCEKIAPKLAITKRFAGEEPFDSVTELYNKKMKETLPKYGIEYEEIPRLENPEASVISATVARQYFNRG